MRAGLRCVFPKKAGSKHRGNMLKACNHDRQPSTPMRQVQRANPGAQAQAHEVLFGEVSQYELAGGADGAGESGEGCRTLTEGRGGGLGCWRFG